MARALHLNAPTLDTVQRGYGWTPEQMFLREFNWRLTQEELEGGIEIYERTVGVGVGVGVDVGVGVGVCWSWCWCWYWCWCWCSAALRFVVARELGPWELLFLPPVPARRLPPASEPVELSRAESSHRN